MYRSSVTMHVYEHVEEEIKVPVGLHTYRLRGLPGEARWYGLGRWLLGVMAKLGLVELVEYVSFKSPRHGGRSIRVSVDALLSRIHHELHQMGSHLQEIDFILVGQEEFECITAAACYHGVLREPIGFIVNLPNLGGVEPRIMGYQIRVVPWFKGILVVPKVN